MNHIALFFCRADWRRKNGSLLLFLGPCIRRLALFYEYSARFLGVIFCATRKTKTDHLVTQRRFQVMFLTVL